MKQKSRPPFNIAWLRYFLPTPGNALFTLFIVGGLFWASSTGAVPLLQQSGSPINTIPYQGRLADASGAPLTGTYTMVFRLYSVPTGGTPLWIEQWTGSNGVQISDGLFNVMLGSLTPVPQNVITENNNLWLGITVDTDDEMVPRVQIGTLPFAVQALTVPDNAITTAKLANGSVTQAKLGTDISMVPPDGSVTTQKIANGAVTDVWFLAPSQDDNLPANTDWRDVVATTLPFTLTQSADVFLSYSINVGPHGSAGSDFVATRLVVDGIPSIASGSHFQPFSNGDSNTNVNGNILLPLSAGQHTVKLQWKSGGTTTPWGTNPDNANGAGARTITVIAFYR